MESQISRKLTLLDIFNQKDRDKENDAQVNELFTALSDFKIVDQTNFNTYHSLTARSLDSVINLTEYEDQKANRILTAIAFLSALSGIIFSALLPKYKDGTILLLKHWDWSVWSYYISFGAYVVCLILGAGLVIYAISPRFNNPPSWRKDDPVSVPGSLLFFEKILEIRPKLWVDFFKNKPFSDLQTKYIKGNIAESYIISQKIRDKLVYLQPGIRFLNIAVFLLIPWFVCCGIIIKYGPVIENSSNPLKAEIQEALDRSTEVLEKADKTAGAVGEFLKQRKSAIISAERVEIAYRKTQTSEWNAVIAEKKARNSAKSAQNFVQKAREIYLDIKRLNK